MNGGGITKRIVKLASALVGHITGSLAHITILASMLFASMSGSSAASAASIGSMLIPTMKESTVGIIATVDAVFMLIAFADYVRAFCGKEPKVKDINISNKDS
jgi:TRAP-type C4-dicarboxylate transport system permease large subunit